ncbi:MAG: acyltransferase [Microthrixaceae bacterium]|nr:acyltransferase [Microthrixaceae bacterium]
MTRVTTRAPGLDVLRVLGAAGVLVTHVAFVSGVVNESRFSSPLRHVLPRLDVGVSIFFVLSGLLVSRPFVDAVVAGRPLPPIRPYLWRRALRIYPLYWVILFVTLAASGAPLPGAFELLSDVLLLHVYVPSNAIGPITQSWSLATEVGFYLLLPVCFGALARVCEWRGVETASARRRAVALVLVGWVVVAFAFRLVVVAATTTFDFTSGGVDTRGAILTWTPNHLDEFAVGAGLALWLQSSRVPRVTRALRAACYSIAAAALWVASVALDLPPVFTGFDGAQTFARHGLFVLCAATLVAPSAFATAATSVRASETRRWWRLAETGALGSYGIYLWHQLVMTRWMGERGYRDFLAPFIPSLVAVAGISALLAAVSYWGVERPTRPLAAVRWRLDADVEVRSLGVAASLDGLRGLSILAVLGTHVVFLDSGDPTWSLRGGFLGVDVFLVLSGFLIGATLLREVDATGGVRLGLFLSRRGKRLVPPLAGFLVIHLIVALAVLGDAPREQLLQVALGMGFVGNWQLAAGHQPPYDMVHLWSLALEGQLYVLCGLAVWWARRRLDRTPVLLAAVGAAVMAIACWRVVEVARGASLVALYERTDARADAMLVGLGTALLWRSRLVGSRAARVAGVWGASGIGLAWIGAEAEARWLFLGGFTGISIAAGAVVLAAVEDGSVIARIGGLRPLRWVGRISYSLYLWHLPVYIWTVRALPDAPLVAKLVIAVPASILAGWAGYRAFERWIVGRPRTIGPA